MLFWVTVIVCMGKTYSHVSPNPNPYSHDSMTCVTLGQGERRCGVPGRVVRDATAKDAPVSH